MNPDGTFNLTPHQLEAFVRDGVRYLPVGRKGTELRELEAYLGFGSTVVRWHEGVAVLACLPRHAQWQGDRLASGLWFVGEARETFDSAEEAMVERFWEVCG